MARLPIDLPEELKSELAKMANETNFSQNSLINMAVMSLVANYKAKGTFIFVDLLNPDHRHKKMS